MVLLQASGGHTSRLFQGVMYCLQGRIEGKPPPHELSQGLW